MPDTLSAVLQDKDFLSAHPNDQMAYLSSIDPDFAKASPEDRGAYLNQVLAPARKAKAAEPTQFEKDRPGGNTLTGDVAKGFEPPSMLRGAGTALVKGLAGIGSGIVHSIDPTRGLSGAGLEAIGLNPRQGGVGDRLREIPAVGATHEIISAHKDPAAKGWEVPLAGAGSIVGESAENARGHAARGESGAIIGEAAAPALATLATYLGPKVAPKLLPKLPPDIGTALRTEGGELRPSMKALGHAGGATLGATIGHLTGVPGLGAAGGMAGGLAGKALLDALIPNLPKAEVVPVRSAFEGATSTLKPIGSKVLPSVGSVELPKVTPPTKPVVQFPGATPTLKPIGSAELPKVKTLEPIQRMPEEIYQRPIEAAPGAGKEPAPAEMHPDELAAIRKEAGKPAMTAEEAHRYRVNKMASTAAAAKPGSELGELPRAGEANRLEPADKAKSPRGYFNPGRSEPVKLNDLVDQAAGVKPLRPEVPLIKQLTSRPAASLEEVDPVKAKYPDPAVRQMVRANGEAVYEAAKKDPATVKAIHDLTRVELRNALINAGEDMGQITVSNSKFAGEGSIAREEAFNRLLKRGLSPERIIELAKKTSQ